MAARYLLDIPILTQQSQPIAGHPTYKRQCPANAFDLSLTNPDIFHFINTNQGHTRITLFADQAYPHFGVDLVVEV